jgi:cell division protein FtsI/penicillin-binding protein 2
VPLEPSTFSVGYDKYDLARTAAGFGSAYISPLHAALLAAVVGNGGRMPRPYLIERIEDRHGNAKYEVRRETLSTSVSAETARELLSMMRTTVESGTARKHFWLLRKLWGESFPVAAKTGTLSGDDPKGVYHWFIATAPIKDPQLAIAALVIDPGGARVRGSGLGSKFLQYFHALQTGGLMAAEKIPVQSAPVIRSSRRRTAVIRSHPSSKRRAAAKAPVKKKTVSKKKSKKKK